MFKCYPLLLYVFCLLIWFDSSRPINDLSVKRGFLGWTSTKLGLMCLAQGHNAVTPVRLEPEAPHPLVYREERHRALGRDATFSWSRALTHPPRCNRTRHRGRHLVSDFVGAAILDLTSWGPPSWFGSRGGRHLGSEVVGAAILDLTSWRHWRLTGAYTTSS